MDVLISSDWQTRLDNLARCEKSADEVVRLCHVHKLEAVVVAGDLKHHYNPIDYRVIRFWRDYIQRVRNEDARILLLLGNHDRINLYDDADNWLPVLNDAGAEVFWDADYVSLKSGRLHVLPFQGTKERWQSAIAQLHKFKTDPRTDVLVFHQTITGIKYNKLDGGKPVIVPPSDNPAKGIQLADLQPSRYKYCIGGDIHLPQKVANNVWYVGSPFPMDWGEINQHKRFALITESKLKFVPTGMPGWYDPAVKGFEPPKSWNNTRVRITIPMVKGGDHVLRERKAIEEAKTKYPGAEIVLVADVRTLVEDAALAVPLSLPEHEQVREYVKQVLPDRFQSRIDHMLAYIEDAVRATGLGLRSDAGVQFIEARAKNFLSFKTLRLLFNEPGITIVTGENKDWYGRSNGSGKSNALSVIPVALNGRTLKGQRGEHWGMKDSSETGEVELWFKTAVAGKLKVKRTCKPPAVQLFSSDKEISAGSRSTDVGKDIERISGYSWDMLTSLLYLSREETQFLDGSPAMKYEILARLRNLERFGKAKKPVSDYVDKIQTTIAFWSTEINLIENALRERQAQGTAAKDKESQEALLRTILTEISEIPKIDNSSILQSLKDQQSVVGGITKSETSLRVYVQVRQRKLSELSSRPANCPTCGQPMLANKADQDRQIEALRREVIPAEKELRVIEADKARAMERLQKIDAEYDKRERLASANEAKKQQLQIRQDQCRTEIKRLETLEAKHEKTIKDTKQYLDDAKGIIEYYNEELEFYQVAEKLLSRDGIAAYLSQLSCPKLNKAAQYYSRLFSDGAIQVQFIARDGEIDVDLINIHGGETIKDQSSGEGNIASLIASFALRDVAPKSNVLILDEPGDGLDATNARVFAAGLRKLADKYSSIFLITHNDAILSELQEARILHVVKENGISTIVRRDP